MYWQISLFCFLAINVQINSGDQKRLKSHSCSITFYSKKNNQCPCWTFEYPGTWKYDAGNSYKQSTPDRNLFLAKSISIFPSQIGSCDPDGRKRVWQITQNFDSDQQKTLNTFSTKRADYPDITKWEIGQYRMYQWRVRNNPTEDDQCKGEQCSDIPKEITYLKYAEFGFKTAYVLRCVIMAIAVIAIVLSLVWIKIGDRAHWEIPQ